MSPDTRIIVFSANHDPVSVRKSAEADSPRPLARNEET